MFFYFTVRLSSIYTINKFYVFPVLQKCATFRTRPNVKFSFSVPEEGWFAQPKNSAPS